MRDKGHENSETSSPSVKLQPTDTLISAVRMTLYFSCGDELTGTEVPSPAK